MLKIGRSVLRWIKGKWQYLRRGKKFVWTPPEFERMRLEKAYRKNFEPSINYINAFLKGGEYTIVLEYENSRTKELESRGFPLQVLRDESKRGVPFRITLPKILEIGGVEHKESYGLSKKLRIEKGATKFVVERNSVTNFHTVFPKEPQILTGEFMNFRTDDPAPETSYRRLIVPIVETDITFPSYILDFQENHMRFDIAGWDRQRTLLGLPMLTTKGMYIDLKIDGFSFHFYAIEPMKSLVIDSIEKITKEDFVRITNTIRTAMAFLSGKFYRDTAFYLSSSELEFLTIQEFEINVEEHTLISGNQIINPEYFFTSYKHQNPETKDKWKPYHIMFPTIHFESLCNKMLSSTEFLRTIELVITAGSITDPIQKGALYSVAVETITEHLKAISDKRLNPIEDVATAKSFIVELTDVLNRHQGKLSDSTFNILKTKIDNINTPTNRDKLTQPFELAGITLTDEDKRTLDQRNKYLHGGKPQNVESKEELDQIALKLHSLISKLILKHIGYKGHFIHLPSYNSVHNFEEMDKMLKTLDFSKLPEALDKLHNRTFKDLEELESSKELLMAFGAFNDLALELEKIVSII